MVRRALAMFPPKPFYLYRVKAGQFPDRSRLRDFLQPRGERNAETLLRPVDDLSGQEASHGTFHDVFADAFA